MKRRGYDTSQLFREDTIIRILCLYSEIVEIQKQMAVIRSQLQPDATNIASKPASTHSRTEWKSHPQCYCSNQQQGRNDLKPAVLLLQTV